MLLALLTLLRGYVPLSEPLLIKDAVPVFAQLLD
jgi:hypothetical protein